MPNTSKGFPYPNSSDDPDIPSDIQALAQAIDTGLNSYSQTTHTHTGVYATTSHTHSGVYSEPGHTHAEYLTATDLTGYSLTTHNHTGVYATTTHNHDGSYASPTHTHANYLDTTTISGVKGAIPVGTTTGFTSITPGQDDYVLVSDSTSQTGTKWASLVAVGTVVPNAFSNISVSGQNTVSADSTSDTLTFAAGSNISITTNSTTDTITIASTGGDVAAHTALADPHSQYLLTTEADLLYDTKGAAAAAQTAAQGYTDSAITSLVNSAPAALNTLKELSDALGGDASFATTVTNSIATKAPLNSPTFTGSVDFTGATVSGIYPTQTNNSGKYLTTNGTTVSWATVTQAGGDVVGPASSTDNAVARFDLATGKLIQNSLVTISDTGAITAPSVGNVIPFYYDNQAAFPSATTYHGAIAHSHQDGSLSFAHGGSWVRLQNVVSGVSDQDIGRLSGLTSNIQTQLDSKAPSANPIFTGIVTFPATGSSGYLRTNSNGAISVQAGIPNADLQYSYINVNGSQVTLGGSVTIDSLPPQSGNAGEYLKTNGTTATWEPLDVPKTYYSNGMSTSSNKIFYNTSGTTDPGWNPTAGDIYIQHEV